MTTRKNVFTARQMLFKEVFVGTLLYAVVLGFFNDYTAFVDAESFSTLFFASFVLQLLTILAFRLKGSIVSWLKEKQGAVYRFLTFFFVWLVMFLSKFVFVWVIDMLFGNAINIYGFFGILLVVLTVTIIHKLTDVIFVRLGHGLVKVS